MVRVVVRCRDPRVARRLAGTLDALACPYRVADPAAPAGAAALPGAVHCMDSGMAAELPGLPGPTVVVLSGARVSDEGLARLRGAPVAVLRLDEIAPGALLAAVLSAGAGSDLAGLAEQLRALRRLEAVQQRLVAAFLGNPPQAQRLADLRRALAPLSREGAQGLVRASGFARAEHLFTALRCAAWMLLVRQGLDRRQVEAYLGIADRASFRRACRRAGVPAPHRALRPETFDAKPVRSAP